jgi:hypothetical protein
VTVPAVRFRDAEFGDHGHLINERGHNVPGWRLVILTGHHHGEPVVLAVEGQCLVKASARLVESSVTLSVLDHADVLRSVCDRAKQLDQRLGGLTTSRAEGGDMTRDGRKRGGGRGHAHASHGLDKASTTQKLSRPIASRGILLLDAEAKLADRFLDSKRLAGITQRCLWHKERNVMQHLPERDRPSIKARMRRAWRETDYSRALEQLTRLADELEHTHPGAAGSLSEGIEETLTVIRLEIKGKLRRTLESTNACESMIDCVRTTQRNVKHWSSGEMGLRWTAAGMLEAEKQFRKVIGYTDLPRLAVAIERRLHLPQPNNATTQEAAITVTV